MNARLIAVQVGDALKYSTSINAIDRIGSSVLLVNRDDFPNNAITSSRAQRIHDWILSLARSEMQQEERERRLISFCKQLSGESEWVRVSSLLAEAGVTKNAVNCEHYNQFMSRGFHSEVVKHSQKLFLDSHYFHAVFEAAKAYNKAVREKAISTKDGQSLMLDVWGWEKGCLKLTPCVSDTDKNVQDGVRFLSAGLMSAIRNPTAHEPANDWPISLIDCLDILSFITYLFRQLDNAHYFRITN